jgi:quercetin dioxygenase-like cupin family protein
MKEIEVILKTDSARVRILSLDPHETANWHYHIEVTDDIFCLTGAILVRVKEPDEEIKLTIGKRCQIQAGRIHQLENLGSDEARYLLVQGVGKYDFNVVGE